MKTFIEEEIILLLRKQISSTNLYDRSSYNVGYRDALRDMVMIISEQVAEDYGK